jgi:farnesyl diphosphate synthase
LTSFQDQLTASARLVEARLQGVLDAEASRGTPERLINAMRHGVLGGGKRFRPFLLIQSAQLFGVDARAAVEAAAAIECIHCYSLIHDDLPAMDNDELRRGQPTVWKAYDEWTAILAGDALQALAFELLSAPQAHADAAVRAELVHALAVASGSPGMVGGQALDLEAGNLTPQAKPDIAHITRLQAMKTGHLINAACAMGAILGRATAEQRTALKTYGDGLGFAFQISDDLLDAEGNASTVGKATGKDAAAGKATLVSLLGIEAARVHLDQTVANAVAALKPFGPGASALIDAARFMGRRGS